MYLVHDTYLVYVCTWYHTKTKISRTHAHFFSPLKPRLVEHTHEVQIFFGMYLVAIRNSLRSNKFMAGMGFGWIGVGWLVLVCVGWMKLNNFKTLISFHLRGTR